MSSPTEVVFRLQIGHMAGLISSLSVTLIGKSLGLENKIMMKGARAISVLNGPLKSKTDENSGPTEIHLFFYAPPP